MTREQAITDVAHALYRRSDRYEPAMPELWQRSATTSSYFGLEADAFVAEISWLADFIAALPSEDDTA